MKKFLLSFIAFFAVSMAFADEVTFDFSNASSLNPAVTPAEAGKYVPLTGDPNLASTNADDLVERTTTFTNADVSFLLEQGAATTVSRLWSKASTSNDLGFETDLRTAKNSTNTISVPEGMVITKIVFVGGKVGGFSVTDGTFSSGTWEGKAQSVVFTGTGTTNISTVTVTYKAAAATPAFYEDVTGKLVKAIGEESVTELSAEQWYLLTQVRGGETPAYDAGEGSRLYRAAAGAFSMKADDSAEDFVDYLVRFIPTENAGAYNIQFANGRYVTADLNSGSEAGEYNVYPIGTTTHWGINLYNMGSIVDNNAAGNTLAFWDSGEVTGDDGNNHWRIYTVDLYEVTQEILDQIARNKELAEDIEDAKALYASNDAIEVVAVGDNLITTVDQLSSPYTETEEGSLEALLDGKNTTYWHSDWSTTGGTAVDNHLHYLQVELAEAISGNIQATMSRRADGGADHLTQACVHASVDGTDFVELCTIDFPYTSASDVDLKAVFNLGETAYKYLRFYENTTTDMRGYFHMSEFQLNAVTEFIPSKNTQNADAAKAFQEAIEKAQTAVDGGEVTQSNIDALAKAVTAYENAFKEFTCAEINAIDESDIAVTMGAFEVVRVFNGGYIYIKDETGNALIYKQSYGLKDGDRVAAGFKGTTSPYRGVPQLAPVSAFTDLTVTAGEPAEPVEATEAPSRENVNAFVVYKGVTVAETASFTTEKETSITVKWNDIDIAVYNKGKKQDCTLEAGVAYDIVAFNSINNTSMQVFPISITAQGGEEEPLTCDAQWEAVDGSLVGTLTFSKAVTAISEGGYAFIQEKDSYDPEDEDVHNYGGVTFYTVPELWTLNEDGSVTMMFATLTYETHEPDYGEPTRHQSPRKVEIAVDGKDYVLWVYGGTFTFEGDDAAYDDNIYVGIAADELPELGGGEEELTGRVDWSFAADGCPVATVTFTKPVVALDSYGYAQIQDGDCYWSEDQDVAWYQGIMYVSDPFEEGAWTLNEDGTVTFKFVDYEETGVGTRRAGEAGEWGTIDYSDSDYLIIDAYYSELVFTIYYGSLKFEGDDDFCQQEISFGCSKDDVVSGIYTAIAAEKAGKIYNLNGQQINKALRGINIIGGKKVLVK